MLGPLLSCSSIHQRACCRPPCCVVARLVAWLRGWCCGWLLASACVVAVRAGMEAKDSDLWLLAVVRCDCAAAGMHVRSVRRARASAVCEAVGGWVGPAAVALRRDGGE